MSMICLAAIGKQELPTEAFAKHFFSLLDVPYEERESSHYEEGGYFKGIYHQITFMVYRTYRDDIERMPSVMPYTITAEGNNDPAVDQAIDFVIRSKLIPEGYKFLQEIGRAWIDFS